jgi:hypothetical protein
MGRLKKSGVGIAIMDKRELAFGLLNFAPDILKYQTTMRERLSGFEKLVKEMLSSAAWSNRHVDARRLLARAAPSPLSKAARNGYCREDWHCRRRMAFIDALFLQHSWPDLRTCMLPPGGLRA